MSRRIHGKRKAVSANHIRKTNSDRKATKKMLRSGEDLGKMDFPKSKEKYVPFDDNERVIIGKWYCLIDIPTGAIYPKYEVDPDIAPSDDFSLFDLN